MQRQQFLSNFELASPEGMIFWSFYPTWHQAVTRAGNFQSFFQE